MSESMTKSQGTEQQEGQTPVSRLRPAVDVIENADGITLFADMPGVRKENLHVHVEGDNLQIEGKVDIETSEGLRPVYVEFNRPVYQRAFTLSRELDPENIQAELQNGVLRLKIPKTTQAQPRRIEVRTA